MRSFKKLDALVAPMDVANVDTDQIIPKQFLKRIERTGYGDVLFYDWRYLDGGEKLNSDFEMNAPRYDGAGILLARDNFGCGSSREHAPWALNDYGVRCVIAPSFADIFYNNCFNNGMLPIVLDTNTVDTLFSEMRATEGYRLVVDVKAGTVTKPDGTSLAFELDDFLRTRLLEGLDQIGLTLQHEDKITTFEKARGL